MFARQESFAAEQSVTFAAQRMPPGFVHLSPKYVPNNMTPFVAVTTKLTAMNAPPTPTASAPHMRVNVSHKPAY